MKTGVLIQLMLCLSFLAIGQQENDSTLVSLFRDKKVVYLDLGANSAPYTFSYPDGSGNDVTLQYRNNIRTILGLGFSYKWFALRLATNLPLHFSSVNKNGETNYKDIVLEFKVRRQFFDLSLHTYKGYAIHNAYTWDSTLTQETFPNYILKENRSLNLGLSHWFFLNKNIDMSAIKGKKGMYLKKQTSFYLKSTVNFNGITNEGPLIPEMKQNPYLPETTSSIISTIDFGFVPGYLYVNNYKNFHYSGMLGLGAVGQSKFYDVGNKLKNFPGVTPRFDARFYLAYNVPKLFLILSAEFENKSIRFQEFRYNQVYYMFRLTGGIRL